MQALDLPIQFAATYSNFSKIAEDGTRTTSHDTSNDLLYASADVIFLTSDALSR